MTLNSGFRRELENLGDDAKEKAQAVDPRGRKYRGAPSGADHLVVVVKHGNACGAKGVGHPCRDRFGQLATGGTGGFRPKGWHEPDTPRGLRPVL